MATGFPPDTIYNPIKDEYIFPGGVALSAQRIHDDIIKNIKIDIEELTKIRYKGKELKFYNEQVGPQTWDTPSVEKIIGALQDGVVPGPGREDLEMLADLLSELVVLRKQNQNIGALADLAALWSNNSKMTKPSLRGCLKDIDIRLRELIRK